MKKKLPTGYQIQDNSDGDCCFSCCYRVAMGRDKFRKFCGYTDEGIQVGENAHASKEERKPLIVEAAGICPKFDNGDAKQFDAKKSRYGICEPAKGLQRVVYK